MATLSNHHRELTNGVGKCSVPMWCGGLPAGFCDEPAYGNYIPGAMFRDGRGEMRRYDGKYSGYVPALACPHHGGPDAPPPQQGGTLEDRLDAHDPDWRERFDSDADRAAEFYEMEKSK